MHGACPRMECVGRARNCVEKESEQDHEPGENRVILCPPLAQPPWRPADLPTLRAEGHGTRSLQAYLGHKNIQHTVRYTELSPNRFANFWKD
jgi:hypothetical protein